MPNSESVGKKIVEALKKQAENMEVSEADNSLFDTNVSDNTEPADDIFSIGNDDIINQPATKQNSVGAGNFFDDVEEDKDIFYSEPANTPSVQPDITSDNFEMPENIAVLKKLISQLPSGVSRHTGAQIIKQTMEALGISMKSVLQDAQQVQESLKVSARECQASIQEYKKQILALEKQSQSYQKQYSALNDLISLFIQTTK